MTNTIECCFNGEIFEVGFIDLLPCEHGQAHSLMTQFSSYLFSKGGSTADLVLNTINRENQIIAIFHGNILYLPESFRDDKEALDGILETAFMRLHGEYVVDKKALSKYPHDESYCLGDMKIHEEILRSGFVPVLSAIVSEYDNSKAALMYTVGLQFSEMPELLLTGAITENPTVAQHVLLTVSDYFAKHGFREGLFTDIFESRRIKVNLIQSEDLSGICEGLVGYWGEHGFSLCQVIYADHDNLLPDEQGYCQGCNHQPLLPKRFINA